MIAGRRAITARPARGAPKSEQPGGSPAALPTPVSPRARPRFAGRPTPAVSGPCRPGRAGEGVGRCAAGRGVAPVSRRHWVTGRGGHRPPAQQALKGERPGRRVAATGCRSQLPAKPARPDLPVPAAAGCHGCRYVRPPRRRRRFGLPLGGHGPSQSQAPPCGHGWHRRTPRLCPAAAVPAGVCRRPETVPGGAFPGGQSGCPGQGWLQRHPLATSTLIGPGGFAPRAILIAGRAARSPAGHDPAARRNPTRVGVYARC